MVRRCYVYKCDTNAKPTVSDDRKHLRRPVFSFPRDEDMRREWFKRIPNRKKNVNLKHLGVCILHFESRFIKSLARHTLSKDAIPTIFPSFDEFDTFDASMEDFNFCSIDLDDLSNTLETTTAEINNFDYLRSHLTQKLELDNWIVATSAGSIYIFNLNKQPNGNLSIRSTIAIDSDLIVKVFVNDNLVEQTMKKISQWSQLQNIIDELKFNVDCENDKWHTLDILISAKNDGSECAIKCENLESSFDNYMCEAERLPSHRNQQEYFNCTTTAKVEVENSHPNIEEYFFNAEHAEPIQQIKKSPKYEQDILNQSRHICSTCGKEYDQYAKLMIHMKRHDPSECQTCQICNKNVYGNINRHMRTHVKKKIECDDCGTAYKNRKSLQNHWNSTHFIGEFYCDICNKGENYRTKSRLKRHMSKHINAKIVNKPAVDIENFQFEWFRAQQDQVRKQQSYIEDKDEENSKLETDSPINDLANNCPVCGKTFSKSRLAVHMRRHDRSRWKVCPICKKSFPDGLSRHMDTHSKLKKYVCDICGLAYSQSWSLKTHKEINHFGLNEYFCDICGNGRKYRSRYNLRKHLKSHVEKRVVRRASQKVVLEKNHECSQCSSKFINKYLLNVHMLSAHTAEKQFECDVCLKKFAYKRMLVIHKELHSTDKKHTCEECGKSFVLASYLRKHLPRHKGLENKRKRCYICDKRYVSVVDLRSHLKKIHGIDKKPGENCT